MNRYAVWSNSPFLMINCLSFGILMQCLACAHAESSEQVEFTSTSSTNFTYPKIDPDLGEHLNSNEKTLAAEIVSESEKRMRAYHLLQKTKPSLFPKKCGCIKARFTIMHNIPEFLAQGVFVPDKSYKAWIRFSTADSDPTHANPSREARKMFIKLTDVAGEKLSREDFTSQDFILINPTLELIRDPRRYLQLMNETNGVPLKKAVLPFALESNGEWRTVDTVETIINNPFYVTYRALGPSQLGLGKQRLAVKLSVKPCSPEVQKIYVKVTPNYLEDSINTLLLQKESCMQFLVQPRTSLTMDVEDSTATWKESLAPLYSIATLYIPQQNTEDPEQQAICEKLFFSSWHTLPAHRPLGMNSRLRKVIYDHMYSLNQKLAQ
jgi:hypothetical protein